MRISDGHCTVERGEALSPEAIVSMSAADFVGINEGTVSAVDTFWGGLIEIEGNIDVILALPPIMNWR